MRFPMFVELEGEKVLVVGAGTIGTRRIHALWEFGADVLVVAPEASPEVRKLAEQGQIRYEERTVRREDLAGMFFVTAAADSREVNHQIYVWCREMGILVNVADKKEECSFYFPGLAREGALTAGVCAGGTDHRLARRAAEEVRALFREKFGRKME